MKREIKFRSWNESEMHGDGESKFWLNQGFFDDFPDKFIIMQFTGLHDKNGREIYEGDIVRLDDIIVSVTWHDAAFHIIANENQGASVFVQDRARKFEVIGNIYENSDLLKA